ncbi:MAG: hypothetical protein ACD_75C02354G0001 [uncultured bacterium]|nr:MAG: hypothetical protein ACD_75C02354G0001 [uncultured bacterium]
MNIVAEQCQLLDQQAHGNGCSPVLEKRLGGYNQYRSRCLTCFDQNQLLTLKNAAGIKIKKNKKIKKFYSFLLLLKITGEPNRAVSPVSRKQLSITVENILLPTLR